MPARAPDPGQYAYIPPSQRQAYAPDLSLNYGVPYTPPAAPTTDPALENAMRSLGRGQPSWTFIQPRAQQATPEIDPNMPEYWKGPRPVVPVGGDRGRGI